MDPVTHIAAGLLIGQAARDRFPAGRALVPLAALAAWLPDIDNVVGLFGAEAYMRYHRGYSHSLLGGALMAWLLAAVAHRFWRQAGTGKLFILFYLCVLSHLFLDCITSYGTGVFLPFSDARISFPAVFIIDPVYTLSLLALIAASFLRPAARKAFAVAGLAVMLGWPALGYGVEAFVTARAERLLAKEGRRVDAVHVQPDAFAPLWWKVVAEEGNDYVLTGLTLSAPDRLLPERRFEKAGRAELEALGRAAPVFSQYVWFTDYPVKSAANTPAGTTLTFQDLRFMAVNPLVAKVRGDIVPFTLTAYLDPAGKLVRALFSQVGKAEVILPSVPAAIASVTGG
ncbi:MAG: metal-dependent hydrolase [Solidesulfovibrio sp.]|uniref:metal-dependent hydrolase n=1 Tax=Solidesulfovibrio sp. TaxID=2910990 RepID=UPI002B1F02E5|nr:metal-dependent hydrolase [Solidesulfovibrio sp.]MEA4855792.1 metal-dependent hydrolase [Solidesulfovibrio sp.]